MNSNYRLRLLPWEVAIPDETTCMLKIIQRFKSRGDADEYAKFLNNQLANKKAQVVFYQNHEQHNL